MARIIHEACCGYCVQAGNAQLLGDVILSMSRDGARVRKMGRCDRKFTVAHVSKKRAVNKYIETIEIFVE